MDKVWLGAEVEVVIDAPRGSFVKRRPDGSVDFVSPLPTPFNYGEVPGELGGDGDPLDALVVGPRLARGHRARWRVLGVVHFVDAGKIDTKLVCGRADRVARRQVDAFFRVYALAKRLLNRARGNSGSTQYNGTDWLDAHNLG